MGGGAGGEEKRMVVCLLGLGCATWSLTFAVFIDAGHDEEFIFVCRLFSEGYKLREQNNSDERNMVKYSITKYFFY